MGDSPPTGTIYRVVRTTHRGSKFSLFLSQGLPLSHLVRFSLVLLTESQCLTLFLSTCLKMAGVKFHTSCSCGEARVNTRKCSGHIGHYGCLVSCLLRATWPFLGALILGCSGTVLSVIIWGQRISPSWVNRGPKMTQVNHVMGTQTVLRPGLLPSLQASKWGQIHLLWDLEPRICSHGLIPQAAGPVSVDRCSGSCPYPDAVFSVSELTAHCQCK